MIEAQPNGVEIHGPLDEVGQILADVLIDWPDPIEKGHHISPVVVLTSACEFLSAASSDPIMGTAAQQSVRAALRTSQRPQCADVGMTITRRGPRGLAGNGSAHGCIRMAGSSGSANAGAKRCHCPVQSPIGFLSSRSSLISFSRSAAQLAKK